MRSVRAAIAVLGGLALTTVAGRLVAHHAFGAEFDKDAPVRLQGKIVKLEWVNPHTWIHLDAKVTLGEAKAPSGATEAWAVEGGTPNVLLRRGLRRDCLKPGTEIVVDGYQAKDHTLKRANGKDITFTDGSKIFLGSSGTGAPYEADLNKQAEPGRC
jgi:hypothetical protein